MGWYRIRIECIEHQHIERTVWRVLDGQAAIADDDIAIVAAAAQKCEEMRGNIIDLGIDIEECDVAIGLKITCHAAGSKPYDAHMLMGPATDHLHDISGRAGLVVIGNGLTAQRRILAFKTMERISMQQLPHVRAGLVYDFFNTEKVAADVKRFAFQERWKSQTIAENQHRHRERKSQLPFAEKKRNQDQRNVDRQGYCPGVEEVVVNPGPLQRIPGSQDQDPQHCRINAVPDV